MKFDPYFVEILSHNLRLYFVQTEDVVRDARILEALLEADDDVNVSIFIYYFLLFLFVLKCIANFRLHPRVLKRKLFPKPSLFKLLQPQFFREQKLHFLRFLLMLKVKFHNMLDSHHVSIFLEQNFNTVHFFHFII